ncbi:MAG: hypothetical protein H6Q37_779 [Chloroflexi bacterium]|nr:hypothetical protein [Chloroflexota bacterium]
MSSTPYLFRGLTILRHEIILILHSQLIPGLLVFHEPDFTNRLCHCKPPYLISVSSARMQSKEKPFTQICGGFFQFTSRAEYF